jgi:NitT/TauT family transport system substrate-binding protein
MHLVAEGVAGVRAGDQLVTVRGGQTVTRRELLRVALGTGAVLAGGGMLAACAQPTAVLQGVAALPPPETTTVRIGAPFPCDPGLMLAGDFLSEEGFTEVRYVAANILERAWVVNRDADVALGHSEWIVASLDDGVPLVTLAGLHSGCYELWAGARIQSIGELRGKKIAVRRIDTSDVFYAFFATLLGYVGIDPVKDVQFIAAGTGPEMNNAFIEGRADAVLAGGSQGPTFRRLSKAPGHVLLATMTDKPWSQYLCCNLVANSDWARQNPIATKRVTRALLRATDRAAKDPARAAHDAVAAGGPGFDDESLVRETTDMCTYNWRELDPEETIRFFALRLADAKLITSTPQQLIARGTNLAYMRQLRMELTQ